MRKPMALFALIAALAAVLAATATAAGGGGVKTWQVTVTNLTPVVPGNPAAGSSQPLSPVLAVVHTTKADVWSVGDLASAGVAAIAEDADTAPLTAGLTGAPGVRSVATYATGVGPIFSGGSLTFEVTSRGNQNRLSLVSMLVNTNDAFTGLDSLHLRGQGDTYYAMAYDAGSEANNEDADFIPGPCCGNAGVRDATSDPIAAHDGILGGADLDPALWGWTGPAAKIVVERVG